MAKEMLSDAAVKKFIKEHDSTKIETLNDGDGLRFEIRKAGKPRWVFRYTRPDGSRRVNEIAVGTYPELPPYKAREKATEFRALLQDGKDPAHKPEKPVEKPTLGKIAKEFFESRDWCDGHRQKMKIRLNYIPADVMALPLEEITPRLLMDRILRPLEHAEKLETARRVRILISQMFRYGIALGEVYSDPARDLQAALKTPVRESFAAATTPEDLEKIWQAISGYPRLRLRCALQLAALTFQRPFNIRTMEWSEIDLDKRVWTIPAAKMKMRLAKKKTAAAHQVPLSAAAVMVIQNIPRIMDSVYCFPSQRNGTRPMSDAAMIVALRALDIPPEEMTAHGFRSSASSILNASGLFSEDAIERQLAHVPENKVRGIYNRADYWDERVRMMEWWGELLASWQPVSSCHE